MYSRGCAGLRQSKQNVSDTLIEGSLTITDDDLPSIREPYQLRLTLESMKAPKVLIETIADERKQFAVRFTAFVSSLLDSLPRMDALEKLKTIRDKTFAHNEEVSRISGPTWESLQDLIDIAKNVVTA